MTTYMGPTVEEAAWDRLAQIKQEIAILKEEYRGIKARLAKYRGSMMLESERVATETDRFLEPMEPGQNNDLSEG